MVEGLAQFEYLGQPQDQIDDNWPEIRWNIKKLRKLWGQLGKIMQRGRTDTQVLEIFYIAVVQAVLIFGLDSWVVLAAM